MYICPVCGYEKLEEAPANYTICSCCGTEFEYDDFDTSYLALRERWLAAGPKWFSSMEPAPKGWDYRRQLNNLLFIRPQRIIFVESHTEVSRPLLFPAAVFA